MKKAIIFLVMLFMANVSCQRDGGEIITPPAENVVEISLLSDNAATRAAIAEESIVSELDLLIFKGNKFQYWRSAYKVNSRFRATLAIGENLDVYFLANSRSVVSALNDAGQLSENSSWENIREKLTDVNVQRLCRSNGGTPALLLPMWGRLFSQRVQDVPINNWGTVDLIRSVASVDVAVNDTVSNFVLADMYLYFVPDKGYLAPTEDNLLYEQGRLTGVKRAVSPSDMVTDVRLYSDYYDAPTKSIANKFYLYDNDSQKDQITASRRYTRIVVGGYYTTNVNGSAVTAKYYYPIDLDLVDDDDLEKITRNWKYIFIINSASSAGYENPDTASNEPPVGLNVSVVTWNVKEGGDYFVSGPYHAYIARRASVLARSESSTDLISLTSNIPADIINIDFSSNKNGVQTKLPLSGGDAGLVGIENSRFRVEKVKNASGYITGLRFIALGDFDQNDPERNTDRIIFTSGRIEFDITITQINSKPGDWDWGGNIDYGDED